MRGPQDKPQKQLTERLGSWLKLALLSVLPVYLVVDLGLGYWNDEDRRITRENLCFRFEDEADEVLRQRQLPVTVLGKFDHFLRCGSIKEISVLGGKISNERVIATKKAKTEDNSELLALLANAERTIQDLTVGRTLPDGGGGITALNQNLQDAQERIITQLKVREAQIDSLEAMAPVSVLVADGQWLLVVGADQGDKAAIAQVRNTRKILANAQDDGLSAKAGDVELRLIRSWRRTVVPFDSRDMAQAALTSLERALPFGGYVRAQANWCPDLSDVRDIGGIPTMLCQK